MLNRDFMPFLIKSGSLLACCFFSLHLHATETANEVAKASTNSDNGLYQVELILFKHNTVTAEEQWPNTIELRYPEKLVFLDDGKQRFNKNQRRIKTLPQISSKNNKLLNRLEKSNDYKVLYHQLWHQKIASKETASDIVIQVGDTVGDIYPIAGSIKLYKGRYLHIQSNLWFVEFNDGISEIQAAPYNEFFKALEPELNSDNASLPTPESAPDTSAEQQDINNADQLNKAETLALWPVPPSAVNTTRHSNGAVNHDVNLALWTPDIKRIAQIKQHRRMRSHEIHYIDHPLYGLIIEITKTSQE